MSRRRFGSIRRRDSGNYQVRYRGPDGLVYPAPTMFQRESDAERWLALLEADIVRGKWSSSTARRIALGDYADRWVMERQLLAVLLDRTLVRELPKLATAIESRAALQ